MRTAIRSRFTIVAAASAIALGAVAPGCGSSSPGGASLDDEPAGGGSGTPTGPGGDPGALAGKLATKNSVGRSGSYYLPAGYAGRALPMLVGYHGTGGSGGDVVSAFQAAAARRGFIIVAPDSRVAPNGEYSWEVGNHAGEVTDDYRHALDCVAEVTAKAGVTVDAAHVLAAGFSGGGSSAPYLATNERRFTGFAVLHGGVIEGGIGTNVIPGWLSTGVDDTIRPPALVQQSHAYLQSLGFPDVVFRTFPGGHELTAAEIDDLVTWWLDG